uniref:FTH domain-containing protein n=1 Tax=Panagrellus redivivus TaxID=6233 RepID=A0A7E4UPE1_PANRE
MTGLQPIQQVESLEEVEFEIDAENNLQEPNSDYPPENSDETPLFLASDVLEFHKFTSNDKLDVILVDYLFEPTTLSFFDCVLDETFIQRISNALHTPLETLVIYRCTFASENSASMVCSAPAFKGLENFAVANPTLPSLNNWFDAFAEAGVSLKRFHVDDAVLSVLEIDKDIFLKFFKAQCEGFILRVELQNETDVHIMKERFEAKFGDHFERNDTVNKQSPEKYVRFKCDSSLKVTYTLRND